MGWVQSAKLEPGVITGLSGQGCRWKLLRAMHRANPFPLMTGVRMRARKSHICQFQNTMYVSKCNLRDRCRKLTDFCSDISHINNLITDHEKNNTEDPLCLPCDLADISREVLNFELNRPGFKHLRTKLYQDITSFRSCIKL